MPIVRNREFLLSEQKTAKGECKKQRNRAAEMKNRKMIDEKPGISF